ncbi:RsmB/NOP family class I SAM-dependent RNA methyltransferase [Salidesulfovibrio onnuriiensis]|uniref:RsmB/NOP family class I SAM-dependent RNA methyltransferase n=1 Tax=Salidesulfovibrio onnuriiensis TaxID=2583823 RepID=UPI0011C812AA|nr:RsmB/NOP family class I SAM-dependent RNA methyltransferase [Salidesulfovibrio onnuriiensis]
MTDIRRSFRLVCTPDEIPLVEDLLRGQGFSFEPEPFHPLARVLTSEPFPLGSSLAARFGRLYIQDRSSMLPPLALAPPPGASVLDMCAAPGSKTSQLADMVGLEGFVFANEPSADRIGVLRANLKKVCAANTATVRGLGQELAFPARSWDHIQLDPPCSGWGTLDRNPKARDVWTGSRVEPMVEMQKALLKKAASLLRPGGRVLYSTCTTNVEENEEQVRWALEHLDLRLDPLEPFEGFVFSEPQLPDADGVLRVADESEGQGFFLARFVKEGGTSDVEATEGAQKTSLPGKRIALCDFRGGEFMVEQSLPPGRVYSFGGKAMFIHDRAMELAPGGMRWQGFSLGKVGEKGKTLAFKPDSLSRCLMPRLGDPSEAEQVSTDNINDLAGLFAGRALQGGEGKGPVALYYKGLALGWLSRKGKRLLWAG